MAESSSEPPSGFGLPLYEAGNPDLDIVAVHGIGAHRDWTWSLRGVNWLGASDMLPHDFPRARILSYGYASNWLGKDAMSTCLDAVAGRLLSLVHELRKDCPDRNIIFIAHCFGGIVIEKAILKALVHDSAQDRSLMAHISGIVLLGTPHRGSASAGLANIVAAIAAHLNCGQKSSILESVSRDSQMLADTVREFARKAVHLNLRIHCFYEERETDIGAVVRSFFRVTSKTMLVDRDSACLQGHGETALTLDHFRLNKFGTPDDANYTLVRRVLQEMETATEPQFDHLAIKCMEDLYIGDPEYQIRGIEQRWGEIPPLSYEWITDDARFQDWQKNDYRRVLWISGGTRTDRTMLMVGIARELSQSRRQPLAYFFCEHGNCGSSVSILRSLIWRLVHVCPTLGIYLRDYVSHGRRLSRDTLEPQVLSFLLSQMLRDAKIPTVYLLVDSLDKCSSGQDCFQKLVEETASDASSKAKWIISSCLVAHPALTQTGRAIDLGLKDSTLSFAMQTFKPCTMNEMTGNPIYYYRIQGFSSSCVVEQAREILLTLVSAEEQHAFDPKIRMVPTCGDDDGGLTALLMTDRAPHFLYCLDYNPQGDYQLDINGERLIFDRHFFGFTQLSAPPPNKPINADVIAITGLNEHAYASWRGDGNRFGQMWLQDFLGKDLTHCRVLTYGYDSNFSTRGMSALDNYCTEFLNKIKMVRRTAEEANRPLILVGHGFGTIIIAQTLIEAKELEEDGEPALSYLYGSLKAMVFFAVPGPTMFIDNIHSMVADDTSAPSPNLIEGINDALQRLTESLRDFKMYLQGRNVLNLLVVQEAGNGRSAFGGTSSWSMCDKFVKLRSPLLDIPPFASSKMKVNADPSSIARFRTASDPAYQSVVKIFREVETAAVKERNPGLINAMMVQQSGLTILHDPPDAIADIVLIPGLEGDPWETWSTCSRSRAHQAILGKFWPASFLPSHFPEARILVWGFEPNSVFQMGAFLDRASELLHTLTISSSRPLGRSMVFVAHSLGGILLKEMLRLADKGESMVTKDIMRYTSSIIFLGTPHSGDGNALSFRSVVEHMAAGYTTQSAGQELDARLEECQETFLTQKRGYEIRVKCFAEIPDPASEPSGQQARYIVPRAAAALQGLNPPVENIYASPVGFYRFEDESDSEYRKLATELQISLGHIKNHELHLRDDCLKSLYFEQLQSREFDIAIALKSTGTWLFEHKDYTDWDRWDVIHSEQRRGLLWIRGQPGSGKSTLMKKALTQAKDKGRRSSFCVSGFFFTIRSNVQLQKSPLGLFRTLLYDLIQQDKALLTAFITQYKRKRATNFGPWTWHQGELQDFFKSAYLGREFPNVKEAMVFIDALDESDKEGHREAYQVARELVFYFREITAGQKLKVCLSSRHYPEIEVPDCPQIAVENFNNDDIKRFLTSKLHGASEDSRIRKLAKKIASKANGVFLWVILVVETLNMSLANHMTDKGLDEALSDLPGQLEGLFESLFTSTTSKHGLQVAATIFQWVLLAQRPLEKDELRHALTIDREKKEAVENAGDWNLSEECMQGDPEKFLTSLRFYTRGLAQIVLQWEEKPRKRKRSKSMFATPLKQFSPPSRSERPKAREELEERAKKGEEEIERIKERLRERRRERARERAQRREEDEKRNQKATRELEDVDGPPPPPPPAPSTLFFASSSSASPLQEVEDGSKVNTATTTSLPLLNRPPVATDTDETNSGRYSQLQSPALGYLEIPNNPYQPTTLPSASEYLYPELGHLETTSNWHAPRLPSPELGYLEIPNNPYRPTVLLDSAGVSPLSSPESSPVSSHTKLGHLEIPNNPYRPTILPSAPSPPPYAGRPALTTALLKEDLVWDTEDTDTTIIRSVSSCSPVQFIHESVREFFLRGQGFAILEGYQHSKSLAERHEILAQYCMACILQNTVLGGKYAKVNQNAPFLRYASQALFYHLDRAERGDRVPRSITQALFAADQRLWNSWRASTYHYERDSLCEVDPGFAPFHFLCRKRMFSSASNLLALGVDVNVQDSQGNSALHYAVSDVAIDAIQFLTNKQANIRIKNVKGETPLHRAVRCEAPESALMELLRPFVKEAACLEDTDGQNLTPLHVAARDGCAAAVRVLLVHGAQVNTPTGDGWTALHLAVHFYHPKTVEHLLAAGAEVNALTPQREVPIHLAATKPSVSLLGSLIRYGADLNAVDSRGRTPIHIRVLQGLRIGLLLASGANMEARTPLDKQTPLHLAVSCQHFSSENLTALLDAGADRNAADWQGKTPLHYAAEKLPAAFVQRLLQGSNKSINLSEPDRWKRTPLHYAAQRSDLHVFRLLMEAGADLTKADVDNATPVHYARGKIDRDHYLRHFLESRGYKRVVRYIGSQLTAAYDAPNVSH